MKLDPKVQVAAAAAVQKVMADVRGARAAVVSTEDGFEVASRVENTAEIARLSALVSSLATLGAIAGEESQLGACGKVMIEAAHGHIVMVQAHREDVSLVLSVVTGREAIMGQILYCAGEATRALESA